ncbi:MAG TPA: hypothetical protein VG347_11140 [Verrucomicrobiae bacterium]|nr:hypothetical protein [Verrucomicrobiae bacterium]
MIGLALLLISHLSSRANIYFVNSSADGTNIDTLRGAVLDANRHGDGSIIVLIAKSYELDTPDLGSELPVMVRRLNIIGWGQANVFIHAPPMEHVFHVYPGGQLTLINVTLANAGANAGDLYSKGGCLVQMVRFI